MGRNNEQINPQSWEDFKGSYRLRTNKTPISIGVSLPLSINQTDQIDWELLAQQHGSAFQEGHITRERLCSILELRSIMKICPKMTISSLNDLPAVEMLHFLHTEKNYKVTEWVDITKRLPKDECFYTEINIPVETMNDGRLFNLLLFAHELGVIYIKDFSSVQSHRLIYNSGLKNLTFHIPSVTARAHLTQHIFGNAAKTLLGRVGQISIDDIERSVRNKMRYGVFSYPNVQDTTSFHEIDAPVFYMSLHDELHRRLMSSIPNNVIDAYLKAIDLIREKTGFFWSLDIWNAIDLEFGNFDALSIADRNSTDPTIISKHFQTLLLAKKYSNNESLGLFSNANEDLDTLFILLIDLIANENQWAQMGIDRNYFTNNELRAKCKFVEKHLAFIKSLPIAQQVACLKLNWLEPPSDEKTLKLPAHCRFEKIDDYLQVTSRRKIIGETTKAQRVAIEYFREKSLILTQIIENNNKLNHINPTIIQLFAKATEINNLLNQVILQGHLLPLDTIKHINQITEYTAYLITNPSNQLIQNKFSDLICDSITLPQKIKAAIMGFFSAILSFNGNNTDQDYSIQSRVRFFKETYAFSDSVLKQGIDFLNVSRNAPPSITAY